MTLFFFQSFYTKKWPYFFYNLFALKMIQLVFQCFCNKKWLNFFFNLFALKKQTKRWLQNGQNKFYTTKTLLSKNGLRIALGRSVKLLEKKILRQEKKKWVLPKNGLRIALGRLVELLEKQFLRQAKKS